MSLVNFLKCVVFVAVLSFGASAFSSVTVGKVDIQKILLSIKEGKKVRTKLKTVFEKKQKLLKKDEAKIRKMQEDYKKQSLVMNGKAKAKKEREIQAKMLKLQQKSESFQKELRGMEMKMKKPILDKVRKIIVTVSKKAGVDMTFEVSTAAILFAKKEKDLTPEIIDLYNKKHK